MTTSGSSSLAIRSGVSISSMRALAFRTMSLDEVFNSGIGGSFLGCCRGYLFRIGKMAPHLPSVTERAQFRFGLAADPLLRGAATVKAAFQTGRVDRALRIAVEPDAVTMFPAARRQDRRQQRLCIGVRGGLKQRRGVAAFDDLSKIHHDD